MKKFFPRWKYACKHFRLGWQLEWWWRPALAVTVAFLSTRVLKATAAALVQGQVRRSRLDTVASNIATIFHRTLLAQRKSCKLMSAFLTNGSFPLPMHSKCTQLMRSSHIVVIIADLFENYYIALHFYIYSYSWISKSCCVILQYQSSSHSELYTKQFHLQGVPLLSSRILCRQKCCLHLGRCWIKFIF